MRKVIKICLWAIAVVMIVCLAMMLKSNQLVVNNAEEKVPSDINVNNVRDYSQTTIISFLGKPVTINNSLCEQIASIANQDEMLSYSDSIIQIGDVRWRINLGKNIIALMTSVQPDDPKMKQVVKYLNSIYGKPYDEYEDGYKWSSSDDSLDVFRPGCTLVHLRRVHSEEGGTFLFFK